MSKIDRIKALQDNTPQEIWSMNLLMRKVAGFRSQRVWVLPEFREITTNKMK